MIPETVEDFERWLFDLEQAYLHGTYTYGEWQELRQWVRRGLLDAHQRWLDDGGRDD